ncbi:putative phosphoketolase [Leucoagaricus sp. SymC.cos]|nr:putative phosphoketolase [Leucoagaricus sp. SymC.cos]
MPGQQLTQPNLPPNPSHIPDSISPQVVQLEYTKFLNRDDLTSIRSFRRAADYIAAGPGHGAPGVLACLWLEDSLSTFWPKYSRNYEGLFNLITTFSIPGGFPSHINAQTPGAIHEVGELGYALSVAFGAAMDNPDLIYIDPVETGAVLPILHINGFKVSERTTYGAMDDRELVSFFIGYGYQPRMVKDMENIDHDLAALLSWAISKIHKIQHAALLNLKPEAARVYLPPDANCALSTVAHCIGVNNYVNLIIGSKQPMLVWLSCEETDKHCIAGASVRKFASVDDNINSNVILVGKGVEVTFEVIAAMSLLCKHCLNLHIRAVNVIDLIVLNHKWAHPHALDDEQFNMLFTEDRPIHFNYHGYPIELQGLLFGHPGLMERVTIAGYKGEGMTTSPFDMMLCNNTSRFDFAIAAICGGSRVNPKVAVNAHIEISALRHEAKKVQDYIYKHGEDPEGTYTIILLKHILCYEGLFSISLGVWLLSF